MNALVPTQGGIPVGTTQGNWVWDGSNWVCSPCGSDGSGGQFPFCPPPGFPPAGCPPWFSGMNSPPWYPGANAGVSFGNTAPMNAVRGHFWWNGLALMIFDGAVWVNTATGAIVPPDGSGGGGGGSGQGTVIISTTAPGNPVAGMQWWDGTVLRVWDGTQWMIVGPGATAGPVPTTTNVFAITVPTGLSIPTATWSPVPFSANPSVDTLLGYDPISHKYKPTKAGVYQFMIRCYDTQTAFGMMLMKNDTGTFTGSNDNLLILQDIGAGVSVIGGWLAGTAITVMNGTSDYVRMFAYSTGGVFNPIGGNPVFTAWLMP